MRTLYISDIVHIFKQINDTACNSIANVVVYLKGHCLIFLSAIYQLFIEYQVVFYRQKE